jgi:hypothetical protein
MFRLVYFLELLIGAVYLRPPQHVCVDMHHLLYGANTYRNFCLQACNLQANKGGGTFLVVSTTDTKPHSRTIQEHIQTRVQNEGSAHFP